MEFVSPNLMEEIANRLRPTVRNLEIEFSTNAVRIYGRTKSFYGKQIAQETVKKLTEHRIENKIVVD